MRVVLCLAVVLLLAGGACGGGNGPNTSAPTLQLDTPLKVLLRSGERRRFSVAATSGSPYYVSIAGAGDDVDLYLATDGSYTRFRDCPMTVLIGTFPEACLVVGIDEAIDILLDGSDMIGASTGLDLLVRSLRIEAMALNSPVAGSLDPFDAHLYSAAVETGKLYRLILRKLTDDADLWVYGGDASLATTPSLWIDRTLLGVSETESALMLSDAGTLRIAVTALAAAGDTGYELVAVEQDTPALAPGTMIHGNLGTTALEVRRIPTLAGRAYAASLLRLEGSGQIGLVDSTNPGSALAESNTGAMPLEQVAVATGGFLHLLVEGFPGAAYAALVSEIAEIDSPTDEIREIPLQVPVTGQVGARGESRYSVPGVAPGEYTVYLVGLSDDADLRVFADDTYSLELDCSLLRPGDVDRQPEACRLSAADAIHFSVRSGELNRVGATYTLVVQ